MNIKTGNVPSVFTIVGNSSSITAQTTNEKVAQKPKMWKVTLAVILGVVALSAAQQFYEEEVSAWHFHTYFFEVNPRSAAEAVAFRKAVRAKINDGTLEGCSLAQIYIGWDGPHPLSQWETCCNKTAFARAHSWYVRRKQIYEQRWTQNHGNLSILIHPLTIYDQEDHLSRTSWLGQEVILDTECPCLYPVLPKPRPCPVYPEYSDELPEDLNNIEYAEPIPGTEDYKNLRKNFNILNGHY